MKTKTYSLSRKKFQERLETPYLALCDTKPIYNTRATTVTTPDDQGHQIKEFIGELNTELKKKLNDEFIMSDLTLRT